MTTTYTTFTATEEQVSKCTRIVDDATGKAFYLVENSRGDVDEDGSIIEYKVTYDTASHKFACTCEAGLEGFAHCHNKTGYCWHVRASVVAAKDFKKEVLAARIAEANDVEASPEYQAEYRSYLQEQKDIKAEYEFFDTCVPQG